VLRHYLRRKVAPIAVALTARGVQPGAPRRTLEGCASRSNLLAPLAISAIGPAIALPLIAGTADQDLPATRRPRAVEHPERLVDHGRKSPPFSGQAP
jgi:hypothetical protein